MLGKRIIYLPLLLLVLTRHSGFAQKAKIDSIHSALKVCPEDTNRVNLIIELSTQYNKTGIYRSSLLYANEALRLAEKLNFRRGIYQAYIKCGSAYKNQADYFKAMDQYLRALRIAEEDKDLIGMSRVYGFIGNIYDDQGDVNKALEYHQKALGFSEEIGDKKGTASHLGNIGIAFYKMNNLESALYYFRKSLVMREELGDKELIAGALGNIGIIYYDRKNFDTALIYYERSLELLNEIGDRNNAAISLSNIGSLYADMGDFNKAEEYLFKALSQADIMGALNYKMHFLVAISDMYEKKGDADKALIYFKASTVVKDSLFNRNKSEQVIQKELSYEFEKKEAMARAEREKKDAILVAAKQKQELITYFISIALALVVLLAVILYRGYWQKKMANTELARKNLVIERQKKIVEQHQKEVVESITYAKRLQLAILPPQSYVKQHLPFYFITYLPKDIVAGDFYWMDALDDFIYLAAADCTGHGIPGAMVSVVCSNALNRAVKEFGLRDSGKILDKVTELVIETFEKSTSDVKDGMDISLLAINKKKGEIKWSGANNPLWYIKNGKLIDIPGDKQPVGKHIQHKPFTTHTMAYEPDTTFYLFTDGYADQFGGPDGRKLMYKRFKEVVLQSNDMPGQDQKLFLEKTFADWKGELDQVDDVCIVGIRL